MTHPPQLPLVLAFGFGNLIMLGWLAAAVAPLIIHLWNRRKYRETSWAAMEYLLAALRKNARRIRIEQWLLLAVRILLIAAVVVAVAEPYLEQAGLSFIAGQRTLKVFVIDGSYSMAYKPTDKSRFDRAKQLAAQIVEDSSQGDGFTLVLMASPPSVVVGTPALEARDFLEEIENLKMPHGGADLPATLLAVEEILTNAERSKMTRVEVYFLTDLGRNSWAPDLEGSQAAAEYRQRIEQLSRRASLVVIDLGDNNSENVAITSLRATEPFATVAREMTFEAQVRNFGSQSRNHHLVELFVDGRRVNEAYCDMGPGEQAPVSFSYRFEAAGEHVVEARLGPDLLDIDNHRWLSVPVKEYLRVLCVNGKPGNAPLAGSTDYVVLALNPEEDTSRARATVQPEVAPESALLERDLTRYDCIFLCNVGQFTANEASVLDAYLKSGGGLIFFLGDQVLAERYNRELAGDQKMRILPARLKDLVESTENPVHFDPLEYRHPLVAPFKGRELAGLLTTPVYKYFRLEPAERAKVALAFEGGDPAIVEEPIHRGRVILVATDGSLSSVDPSSRLPWTAMAAWPSFVPIVRESLSLAVSGQAKQRNAQVGQVIGDALPTTTTVPVTLHLPDGRHEELRQSDLELGRWSYADTLQSGVYTAEIGTPQPVRQSFAVNVDTAESDLARLEPEELPKEFVLYKRSALDDQDTAAVGRHSGLHKELLYLALGLLFLETMLAWRFGHQTA